MANKPDKIPSSLRWTTFWIVFALIVLSVALALALYSAGQYLVLLLGVDVQPDAYMLWVPLIALAVSAILGTVLAIVLNRYYLRPVAQLLAATRAVAEGDFSVRVPARKNPRDLAECIRSFNKMTAELGRLELLQTDFVNTFSHEFKTPIISIRGFARLLQSERLTPAQRREYTDTIIRESERLAAMSTNVLLLSRYENTGIVTEKTRYPLDEQIRRCIALQERAWLEKDIDIEGELAPVTFYGSEDLVEHIWSNLISNAIRFTPPGGQISVVLRQEGGEVCVIVSDTGCGMDEQTQAHIFDKFYKGAAQQSPGNGLGLAIVRRAVELCGGSIRVASSPGCGSSFFVTLPSVDG